MSNPGFSAIADALSGRDRILIVSHYSPDADAFGSSCGLTLALSELGKTVVCLNEDAPAAHLNFIPGAADVRAKIPAGRWEALVACDCGDSRRLGDELGPALAALKPLINIDHHASNEGFGDLNLVVPNASSTSEIIYEVLEQLGAPISAATAECLLTGIVADTGGFRYSSTSARTFAVAERLVRAGAKPDVIARHLYGERKPAAVKLHGEALRRIAMHADGRVAELLITEEMFGACGASPEDVENLVEAGRDIAGVEVSVLIRRDSGLWKVSLRSKSERSDVSEVARLYGGGGHRQAAAFRFRGELEDLRQTLIPRLAAAAAGEAA